MPYPFTLPTTSHLDLASCLSSTTHPSLPSVATTHRNALRSTLKAHKRLPPAARPSDLVSVLSALGAYVPYIHALARALDDSRSGAEYIEVGLITPPTAEWRPTLSASPPGLALPARARISSLHSDLLFTLLALGQTYYLLARSSLQSLASAHTSKTPPTTEQRTTAIAAAMKYYLQAQSIFTYAASIPAPAQASAGQLPADILSTTLSGLSSLALAEATLLSTAAQDPYPLLASTTVNPNDREWMVSAPTIPKVRAHLFARLCIAAADHAQTAHASLPPTSRLDDRLPQYCSTLSRTGRARAARFLGVDAEAQARSGEAIGWLQGAQALLSPSTGSAEKDPGSTGAGAGAGTFSRLKSSWTTKREDKRLASDGEWGTDAYRLEEARVCELLRAKWEKSNDTIGVQKIEDPRDLMARLPTGREWHTPEPWAPSGLGADVLARVRAPAPARTAEARGRDSSGDEDEDADGDGTGAPGAWPTDGNGGAARVESRAAYY